MKTLFKNIVLAEIDAGFPGEIPTKDMLFTLIDNYVNGVISAEVFLTDLKLLLSVNR